MQPISFQNTNEIVNFQKIKNFKNTKSPLKILGRGSLSVSVNVKAHKFSATAIKKIEAAGGSVQVIE